jgi:hypothetical protein
VLVVVGAAVVVVVGPVLVVVASVVVVGAVVVVASVVVVGAAVVVGAVVGGAAVVVGSVTGGWVLVTATVENASLLVVVPAVAGAWALTGPAALLGPVSGVEVERVGAVVGARGPVGGGDAGLWASSVGRASAGARFGGDGWGSRVAEATRAARTPVVSPKATSMSRQGHRDLVRCRGGDGRCRGGGVDMGMVPVRRQRQGRHGPLSRSVAWPYPVTPLAAFALSGAFDKWTRSEHRTLVSLPRHAAHAKACRHGHPRASRLMIVAWSTFGPHAIGAERFATVSSGLRRQVIRAGCRRDPAETGSRAEP